MTTTHWTVDSKTGRNNSSHRFLQTQSVIRNTLVERAPDLVAGNVRSVSNVILTRLIFNLGFLVDDKVPSPSELSDLSNQVTEIIRHSGNDLMAFGADFVASLLLSKLAHVHHLAPRSSD